MIKYKYFVLLYALQDVILERKKKTKKIDLSRLKVATKSKSRLQQVRRGRSGRIREKSRLSKPTHGRSSCGNTTPDVRGQQNKLLPWFWSMDVRRDADVGAWMNDCNCILIYVGPDRCSTINL